MPSADQFAGLDPDQWYVNNEMDNNSIKILYSKVSVKVYRRDFTKFKSEQVL